MSTELGFDWDEAGGYYAVVNDGGKVLAHGKMVADQTGLATLLGLFHEHVTDDGTLPVMVMEASRRPIVESLMAYGVTVFACNPNELNIRRKGRNKTKSDKKDAIRLVTARRVSPEEFRPVSGPSSEGRAITLLSRELKETVYTVHRLANRVRSSLVEFFPAALDAWNPVALAEKPEAAAILLAFPTPRRAAAATRQEILDVVRATGKASYITYAVDKALKAFAGQQLQYPEELEAVHGVVLQGLLRELQAACASRKALEQDLEARVAAHPLGKRLLEAPGVATSVAGRVIGEMGDDPDRFVTKSGLCAFAGMSPVLSQTGKSGGRHARRQVKGNRLHQAAWDWSGSAVQNSPGAMEYYWRKREEGDPHATSLRKVGRRLMNGLWHVAHTDDVWDETVLWPDASPTLDDAKERADDVRERLGEPRKKPRREPNET